MLSERKGWPALPEPPAVETVRAADGRAVRIRYRLTWAPSGAMRAEAEEADRPPGDGFLFHVSGHHDADPKLVIARLRRIVQREVARAYLEPNQPGQWVDGSSWAIAGAEVAGRIGGSEDDTVREPSVVIDGRHLAWAELGRLRGSFEGWMFRLHLSDSSDDLDSGAVVDDGPDEGADAEVVPLFGDRGSGDGRPEVRSIDTALAGFLVEQEAFDAGDEEAFTRLFGPERIVEGYGEFLGYFMVRKVAASKQQLKDAGTVTKRLARWLAEQG